jgi:hypothetical protein
MSDIDRLLQGIGVLLFAIFCILLSINIYLDTALINRGIVMALSVPIALLGIVLVISWSFSRPSKSK